MSKKNLFLYLFLPVAIILLLSTANYGSAANISLEQPIPLGKVEGIQYIVKPDLPTYISYFFWSAMGIGGLMAVISLVLAGIRLIISAENPERMGEAKKQAISAIVGLVLLLSSFIILNTINPELKKLNEPEPKQLGGVWLMPGKVPAPNFADDLDAARAQGYTKLYWPETVKGIDGKSTPRNNCDPSNDKVVYDIYFFKKKGFQDIFSKGQMPCGIEVPFPKDAKSYVMQKETPGVYLFWGANCNPGDGGRLPTIITESIPQLDKDIGSYCIVNGPDKNKGPFFGIIAFNGRDYQTASKTEHFQPYFRHIKFTKDTYIPCGDTNCWSNQDGNVADTKGNSLVVYQWVGKDNNGKMASAGGEGVTLYSRPGWSGGYYVVKAETEKPGKVEGIWYKNLKETKINYPPNTGIPKEEQKQCSNFVTPGTVWGNYHCLQSIKISGNYLVLVGDAMDKEYIGYMGGTRNVLWGNAQVFPISPRLEQVYVNYRDYSTERGTPNLNADWITPGYADFVEIIPLAKPLY